MGGAKVLEKFPKFSISQNWESEERKNRGWFVSLLFCFWGWRKICCWAAISILVELPVLFPEILRPMVSCRCSSTTKPRKKASSLQAKLLLACMSSVAEFFLSIFCGFAICCLLLGIASSSSSSSSSSAGGRFLRSRKKNLCARRLS